MSPRTFHDESLADLEQAERSIHEAMALLKDGAPAHSINAPIQVAKCRLENVERNIPSVK